MKTKHTLLLGLIVAFSSCSSAYKTGQTPDDVYYSPAPVQTKEAYVVSEPQQDSYYDRNQELDIRRGIQDSRYRGNVSLDLGFGYNPYTYNPYAFNNYSPYSYNPYAFNSYGYKGIYDPYGYSGSPYGYNNFGNYNYGYNYFNPYYGSYYPPVYVYPGVGSVTRSTPRKVNLAAYNNPNSYSNNGRVINGGNAGTTSHPAPVRISREQPSRQTGVGNVIRRVFTPSTDRTPTSSSERRSYNYNNNNNNNSRSNTNPAPARSFDNSPSTSTPPPSNNNNSSSGSAPVRTFRR